MRRHIDQDDLSLWIVEEVEAGRPVPKAKDIAEKYQVTEQSAADALTGLTALGFLSRTWGKGGRSGRYHYELVEKTQP